jgi:hypothetical protein
MTLSIKILVIQYHMHSKQHTRQKVTLTLSNVHSTLVTLIIIKFPMISEVT